MWTTFKIIAALVACYAVFAACVYFSQRRLLFHPSRTMAATPAEIGLAFEDVWLTNGLGTRIHAWWIPCDNARFTLLFSHGNAGNISHRLESLRIFHALGLSIMIYDYSGYGQSQAEPGEAATQADVRAAWDWLVDAQGIAPGDILLFGRSLGGAMAAGLAKALARDNVSPAGLILESTFTSVPDMGAYIYPWLPVRQLAKYQYNTMVALADLDTHVLFAHSPDDDIVPYALGLRLHEAYGGPKSFMEMQGDHNSGYLLMGQAYPDGLDRFLLDLEARK